jgi:16S rRNA G527 N7-methylase RsmG
LQIIRPDLQVFLVESNVKRPHFWRKSFVRLDLAKQESWSVALRSWVKT